jgi:hypothetical protein
VKRVALVVAFIGALALPALAHAAPKIARPDPVTYPLKLDYEDPLTGPDGKATLLAPLGQGVIMAATRDEAYLAFERQDDLGGFVPAPIGRLTLTTGGHDVLSPGTHKPQIPLFQQAAGGKVQSFTFTGNPSGPTPPPDNGNGPIPPPPPPTPGNNNVPPANQGFGGLPGGNQGRQGHGATTTTTTTAGSGGTTTTTKRHPPPTTTTTSPTTTTTTTTGTTTTTPTTTTTGGGGGGGGGGCSGGTCASGSCGVPGIEVDSTAPGCVITLANASPGDSVTEVMTITNTTGASYTLAFRATGAQTSHLWQNGPDGLLMGVWDVSGPPPASFPTLFSWTTQFWTLTTLNAGQSIQYQIELFLPGTAGNADQGKSAVIGFQWRAQG